MMSQPNCFEVVLLLLLSLFLLFFVGNVQLPFFFFLSPKSLFATVKRTEKPSNETTTQFVKYLASNDSSHPGIRLGGKAFAALYEHMFLKHQDGLRGSHMDDVPQDEVGFRNHL